MRRYFNTMKISCLSSKYLSRVTVVRSKLYYDGCNMLIVTPAFPPHYHSLLSILHYLFLYLSTDDWYGYMKFYFFNGL